MENFISRTEGPEKNGFEATNPVYAPPSLHSSNTYGTTTKDQSESDIWLISDIGRWLVGARSYEITGASILLSVLLIALIIGTLLGAYYEKTRNGEMFLNGVKFRMVGLMKAPGEERLFIPIYKEVE